MDGASEVSTMVNQRVGKTTKWKRMSARHVCYKELTLSSLGLAQEHHPIQLQAPGRGGQAVLGRGDCFRYFETSKGFEDKNLGEEFDLGAAVANYT